MSAIPCTDCSGLLMAFWMTESVASWKWVHGVISSRRSEPEQRMHRADLARRTGAEGAGAAVVAGDDEVAGGNRRAAAIVVVVWTFVIV